MTTLVLIAKEPLPGRAKTRLHPPLSLEQAAELAAAAIDDTLRSIADLPVSRRVLFFDGSAVPAGAEGYDLVAQPTGTLDERLAHIFDEVEGPTVLIGMDTPQLSANDLRPAFDAWGAGGDPSGTPMDAWFGPATDGGFWALGLREPRGELLRGIPMSRNDTGLRQLARLREAGLRIGILRMLTDVDTIESAVEVAAAAPHTRFAETLTRFDRTLTGFNRPVLG